jgi:hypothetical protein
MLQKNPKYGTWKLPGGYRDLGWQRHSDNCDEIANCVELDHNNHTNFLKRHWREFDNSLYLNRCTDIITICDKCKIVWHTDMSD